MSAVDSILNVAYICEPHVGGTFHFFRRFRPALAPLGINLVCVPPLADEDLAHNQHAGMDGVQPGGLPKDSIPSMGEALCAHLMREQYAAIMILPGCDPLGSVLPRHLDRAIRCVARVPLMTRGAYAPLRAVRAYVNQVIAVSPRIARDLTGLTGFKARQVTTISNGVESARLQQKRQPRGDGPLRLLYAGRLEDMQKNVFLLVPIMCMLLMEGARVHLQIAGDGPDCEALQRMIAAKQLGEHITLLGAVPLEELAQLYLASDILVLPTRYEGSPNVLLDAMAAGCVPVASRLKGVTDTIVNDGVNGCLASVGEADQFAFEIARLLDDPARLGRMSVAARATVAESYLLSDCAQKYADVLHSVVAGADERAPLWPWFRYEPLADRQSWLRQRIPVPIKNWLRNRLERAGVSV